MVAPVEPIPGGVIEWNLPALADMIENPDGPLAPALHAIGRAGADEAKARALVRTGRMRDDITYQVERGAKGCYVSIVSPARNPRDGFNYPVMHEEAHTRDRPPHRSLGPAAVAAVRKLTTPL